jgi:hypothetical protein
MARGIAELPPAERGSMGKRLVIGVATVMATAATAVPALADSSNAAQKEPFFSIPSGNCTIGATGGGATESFANIKQNGDGTVSAEVKLKNAEPNTTYSVSLVQTPICSSSSNRTIQTNNQGNGNTHVTGPIDSGTTGAFVLVVGPEGIPGDFQATSDYVFASK